MENETLELDTMVLIGALVRSHVEMGTIRQAIANLRVADLTKIAADEQVGTDDVFASWGRLVGSLGVLT